MTKHWDLMFPWERSASAKKHSASAQKRIVYIPEQRCFQPETHWLRSETPLFIGLSHSSFYSSLLNAEAQSFKDLHKWREDAEGARGHLLSAQSLANYGYYGNSFLGGKKKKQWERILSKN